MRLFHYHLVTSKPRETEARYLGRLGFELVARHGRIGQEFTSYGPGTSWEELDRIGFRLRLCELQRGAVNVVVQPGHWELPRVDHLGLALDDEEYEEVLARAERRSLRTHEEPGDRAVVTTSAGFRLELHPPQQWLDDLFDADSGPRVSELYLRADEPQLKARALRDVLGVSITDGATDAGGTLVAFLPGGPLGRPELHGEVFV